MTSYIPPSLGELLAHTQPNLTAVAPNKEKNEKSFQDGKHKKNDLDDWIKQFESDLFIESEEKDSDIKPIVNSIPKPVSLEEIIKSSELNPNLSAPVSAPVHTIKPEKSGKNKKEEKSTKKPPKKVNKVISILSNIVFWGICVSILAGAVLFATSKNPRKDYFGYRTYGVLTDSMTPREDGSSPPGGFRRGDVILVHKVDPKDIRVGDIITFNPNTHDEENTLYLTHRVVEIRKELGGKQGLYFVTRGDYNNSDDLPISSDMVIGKKVFHISGAGVFLQKVSEHFTLVIIIIISFFAFILMFRWYLKIPKSDN